MPHILLHSREELLPSSQRGWRDFLPSGSHLLLLLLQKPWERASQHCPMHRAGKPGEAAGPDAWEGSSQAEREESWLGRILAQLSSPPLPSPSLSSPLLTRECPRGCQPQLPAHIFPLHPPTAHGGKERGMQETPESSEGAGEGVMERAAMLRSALDHSRNHFCLLQPGNATATLKHWEKTLLIPHCYSKVVANQAPSAPRTGWDLPSSPQNPQAPPVLPKTPPRHFLGHLLWQRPGLTLWLFQWGGLKLLQGWRGSSSWLHNIWHCCSFIPQGVPVGLGTLLVPRCPTRAGRTRTRTSWASWPECGASPLGRAQTPCRALGEGRETSGVRMGM